MRRVRAARRLHAAGRKSMAGRGQAGGKLFLRAVALRSSACGMLPSRFLVVGHSHAVCIYEALQSVDSPQQHGYARLGANADRRAPFWASAAILARTMPETLARARAAGRPVLPPLRRAQREAANARLVRRAVSAALAKMIGAGETVAPSSVSAMLEEHGITVLASIGGSEHHVLGMVEFEVPFDFVLPAREDLGTDPTKDLVPYALVRELLEHQIGAFLQMIAVLRDIVGERMLILESPPPIGDNAHILKHLAKHLTTVPGGDWKVPSPSFRYKLWRVSSGIYLDFCRREGLVFVEAPVVAVEDGMFLKREGWRQDAMHGNAWYGARTIEAAMAQLAERAFAKG